MIYSFNNVSKKFGNKSVLEDISFEIEAGKIIGLVGRNGSGKTTTLQLMSNLLLADKGKIFFDSKEIKSDDNYLLEKTSIFFDPERSLYWRLTGLENLQRIIRLRSLDYDFEMEKVYGLLKRLKMYEDRDTYVKDYSQGMKTKILLVSCFIGNPKVLLLDEPFTGLDYESKNEVISLFKEYAEKGGTVILTEHNLIDLQNMCDKIYWFDQGRIIFSDSPQSLLGSILGEGVIKVSCKDRDTFISEMEKLNLGVELIREKDNNVFILSNNLLIDFQLINDNLKNLVYRLELHLKELEDLYLFNERLGAYV